MKEKALQPAAPAQKAVDAVKQEALGIVRRIGTATEAATEPAGATVPLAAAAAARVGTVGPQPPAMPRRKVRGTGPEGWRVSKDKSIEQRDAVGHAPQIASGFQLPDPPNLAPQPSLPSRSYRKMWARRWPRPVLATIPALCLPGSEAFFSLIGR